MGEGEWLVGKPKGGRAPSRRKLGKGKHLGQKVSQNSVCNRPNPWYNRGMKDEIQPSFKAPQIDALLSEIIFNGKDRVTVIKEGKCLTCDEARDLKATSFRDDISRKEYSISGMCQSCQDDLFGMDEADDEPEDYEDDEAAFTSAGMGMDESYYPQEDFGYFGEAGLWD